MARPRASGEATCARRGERVSALAAGAAVVALIFAVGCSRAPKSPGPGPAKAGAAPLLAAQNELPASWALVFAHFQNDRIQILSLAPGATQSRVIYSTAPKQGGYRVPDDAGFLPSPDGQWLLVWEVSSQTDRYGQSKNTQWKLVSLREGTVRLLATTPGEVGLLPHWVSEKQVTLMGDGGIETRLAVNGGGRVRLPPPILRDDDQQARGAYCRRYYATERATLATALQKSRDELGLQEFPQGVWAGPWPEVVSDMVVWPLGLPRLDRRYHLPLRRPQVAVSPDGTLLALADSWTEAPPITVLHSGKETTVKVAGARLVVYRVSSGEPAWTQKAPPKPRRLPESTFRRNPPPLPWVSPQYTYPRWSPDGRYLAFTKFDYSGVPEVNVLEVRTWKQVAHVRGAFDAFLVPVGANARGR